MQQVVGTVLPGRSAAANAAVSFIAALAIAAVSWRFVESPALRLGRAAVRRLGPGGAANRPLPHRVEGAVERSLR